MSIFVDYLPTIVWIVMLSYVLSRHIIVYRLYNKQLVLARRVENLGVIERGTTLVAINQRIRYMMRIGLAVIGLGIGFAGVFALASPPFGESLLFTLVVLAYFYASEVTTGYLTIRDKRVIDRLFEIDGEADEHADIKANTEALDRNTTAVTRSSDSDDARDLRDEVSLKANTEATQTNTVAVTKNTEARDET